MHQHRSHALLLACVGLALALSGCMALGMRPTPAERPSARYSAAAGVALHRSPNAASEVVGTLALHEGVLRYQIEGDYAYVTSEKSGRSGWVRERDLIERLPAPKKTAAAPAEPEPEPEPATEPAPATEPEPPPAPREKSVFDPY
jgi:hypothetical protein